MAAASAQNLHNHTLLHRDTHRQFQATQTRLHDVTHTSPTLTPLEPLQHDGHVFVQEATTRADAPTATTTRTAEATDDEGGTPDTERMERTAGSDPGGFVLRPRPQHWLRLNRSVLEKLLSLS